jgi:hypothetical protein
LIQIAEKDLALKVKHHKQCYEKYGTERYRAPEYGLIISTVLGQVDHDGQHENAARTPIWDETSETYHTRKRRFRHTAIYQTIKALVILRCLYGSEMVLLGVVIGKCEMPNTNISQENGHEKITVKRQFVACNFR